MRDQFQKLLSARFDLSSSRLPGAKEAWERFCAVGLPEAKGSFKGMALNRLYGHQFLEEFESSASPLPPFDLASIDGKWQVNSSTLPKVLLCQPFSEAQKTFGWLLQGSSQHQAPFSLLSEALAFDTLFLYLPPGKVMDAPLRLLFASKEERFCSPRLHLVLGRGAELTVLASHLDQGVFAPFHNENISISLDEGAKLQWIESGQHPFHFSHTHAMLKRDSRFLLSTFTKGSRLFRKSAHIELQAEGAFVDLEGAWALKERDQAHFHLHVHHQAPHCRSSQVMKGVLKDSARSTFDGKIEVDPIAQKTEAYQLNRNLLLGPKAVAQARPNLEILADDVKASHGATVGQIDPNELFYLQSRGLSRSEATSMLVNGVYEECIQRLPSEEIRDEIRAFLLG